MTMHLTIISPERTEFEGQADAIVAPAYDGLVGIQPGHAPFLTLVGDGQVRVRQAGTVVEVGVAGGFLQVAGDTVRIVADRVT